MMKHPPTKPLSPCRAERGFTLVEMLVVVAILGMIVVISIPALRRSMVRAELSGQVSMISQALTVARMSAIKHGQQVCIKLLRWTETPPEGQITAWIDSDGDRRQDNNEEVVGEWPLNTKTSIVKESGARRLRDLKQHYKGVIFLPSGSVIATKAAVPGVGRGSVIVEDTFGNKIRLNIFSGAGTVIQEMYDPEGGQWSEEIRFWRY